mgnify:CR=1 FL=1
MGGGSSFIIPKMSSAFGPDGRDGVANVLRPSVLLRVEGSSAFLPLKTLSGLREDRKSSSSPNMPLPPPDLLAAPEVPLRGGESSSHLKAGLFAEGLELLAPPPPNGSCGG